MKVRTKLIDTVTDASTVSAYVEIDEACSEENAKRLSDLFDAKPFFVKARLHVNDEDKVAWKTTKQKFDEFLKELDISDRDNINPTVYLKDNNQFISYRPWEKEKDPSKIRRKLLHI